jgi:hypothetical protein
MLKLLSKLNIGDTININSMTIHNHESWVTSTKRWLYGENRHKTIIEVENTIAETLYSLNMKFNVQTYNELISAVRGLQALHMTYKGDDVSTFRISKCINLIDSYKKAVELAWNGDSSKLEELRNIFMKIFKDRKMIRDSSRYTVENSPSEKWNMFTDTVYKISSRLVNNELTNPNNHRKMLKYFAPIVIKKLLFPNVGDNMMFLIAFKFIFNHIV